VFIFKDFLEQRDLFETERLKDILNEKWWFSLDVTQKFKSIGMN
jgi:hypothetical protein